MRKEVSVAIIIGIILGAIILYGINLANKTSENLPKVDPTPTTTTPQSSTSAITPSPKTPPRLISSHTNNQVLFEKEITITGKTNPNTQISIIWEEGENLLSSDSTGAFSQNLTLTPGENNIQATKLNNDKTLQSENLKLYYSTKPIE